MSRTDAHPIDRLARRLAGQRAPAVRLGGLTHSDETRMDRVSLLRAGALGVLAFSLRGIPTAHAASSRAAGACTGGSLKACYATIEKNFDRFVHNICDRLKDKKGDPFGTASYECYVGWLSSRLDARKDCRASCPKPKPKSPGRGGGGTPSPPPSSGPKPGCGDVDCVAGDVCCSVKGSTTPICCAIGCAKSGDGCCSSSSDC